ncbi:GDYXXLXY domain-containing protein [Flavobacteriaceae bacterium M23B6Z8]
MKKIVFFVMLILVFAAQWAVPLKMIYDQEIAITKGKLFKFKTQPIDPSDPLRGAYITLNFEMQSIMVKESNWNYNDEVFIVLQEDSLGFAKAVEATQHRPENHESYVTATVDSFYYGTLYFNLPFNRFYMKETKAVEAEKAYRDAQRDTIANNAFALVFIKDGRAVLSDVIINGSSVSKLNE